jgi:hypothetical protein
LQLPIVSHPYVHEGSHVGVHGTPQTLPVVCPLLAHVSVFGQYAGGQPCGTDAAWPQLVSQLGVLVQEGGSEHTQPTELPSVAQLPPVDPFWTHQSLHRPASHVQLAHAVPLQEPSRNGCPPWDVFLHAASHAAGSQVAGQLGSLFTKEVVVLGSNHSKSPPGAQFGKASPAHGPQPKAAASTSHARQ